MVHTRSGAKGQETTGKAGEPSGPAKAKNIVKSDNGVMKKRTESRKPKTTEKKKQQIELESIKKNVEEVYSALSNPAIQEKDRQPLEQSYKLLLDQQQEAEYDLMDIEEENTGAHQDFTGLDYKEGREDSGQASKSTAGSSPRDDLDKREKTKSYSPTPPVFSKDEPSDYADISPIVTEDAREDYGTAMSAKKAAKASPFGDGITLVAGGRRHLNSYGPRNSPMLVWEPRRAQKCVKELTHIHGAPHKNALERDDHDGQYVRNGMIAGIKAIAWKPKSKCANMEDLLHSVEELNPEHKKRGKYTYPYSTVLVDWVDDMKPVWIGRTGYKALTSKGKEAVNRTDRKFYQIACLQVQRYREFTTGKRPRDDRSPTVLKETPEPLGLETAVQATAQQHKSKQRYFPQKSGQGQDAQVQFGPDQNRDNQSGQDPAGKSQYGDEPSGMKSTMVDHGNMHETENGSGQPRTMSAFYANWLRENNLVEDTKLSSLDQEKYGHFRAAADAYADLYADRTGKQIDDDMEIVKQ